mgnify:CR=1 FL=1
MDRHKKSPSDFSRDRKLPFPLLVSFLINVVKNSYQIELNSFFKALGNWTTAVKYVSKAALCKARKKLQSSAFVELNRHLVHLFEERFRPKTWHGFRLVAEDGTMCRLPNIKEIAEHFGIYKVKKGKPSAMARVSQLFDTLNKISIAAVITPKSVDERRHAHELFLNLMPSDLVLLDRGYPAFWLFKAALTMDANFCARINKRWKVVRRFVESGLKEQIVSLSSSRCNALKCEKLGLDCQSFDVRLVRIELESGEVEVLVTSLLDIDKFPHAIFKELYHKRWPVEEDYKAMKCWLQLENFSGKSVLSVYQDFHAKIFQKNLVSVLCFSPQNRLDAEGIKQKYRHQVNFAQALSNMKGMTPLLFQRSKATVKSIVEDLQELFYRTTEPIRPGRKFPRKHKASVRRFFFPYKASA